MELSLHIEGLAFGGKGFVKDNQFVIFVDRTIPGQTVLARVFKVKKNYAEARLLSVIEESQDYEMPVCAHFGTCGGCKHQNLRYERQIDYKRRQVTETLEHIGGFRGISVQETMPSPDIYYYRNKMEFSFSDQRWLTDEEVRSGADFSDRDFALGLHVPGRYDKVLDIEHCHLLSERSNAVLHIVKRWAVANALPPYTTATHTGYVRFLVLREGKNSDQFMVNLVTADDAKRNKNVLQLKEMLRDETPFVSTFVHNINRKKAQIAVGDEEFVLFGPGYIYERLGEFTFQISANSFFQTNSRQCENLYAKIIEWGDFKADDIVYDLYCGAGTIAIYMASLVNKVIGFELVPQAIADAEKNCHLNEVDNCVFVEGDLRSNVADPAALKQKYGTPDTVIIDPPRSGMHPDIPEKIIEMRPEKIIYVSCNPATLARDAKMLCQEAYSLERVLPVDMFPHTPHCEVITVMTKK
ncbi:MAG: 23S rRNA (uracil(1939)-C(5))-methyltransferase RlmD [candidate division KSB1 bacterium]|jgi:23S rRNA (uracil1939-C5)-methyltransferase|nr:23S rRNA (uracil(1939)-C(5))-methyltransferase RlmD [candidate division KSB1 bacterium]